MARKKKAPAVKGNLRNLPDKKQRAIDRIGNIVTMIEVTNGTDIKAYELEPTYQEIGGGGGIDNPVLTINVDGTGIPAQEQGAISLFSINNGVLQKVNTVVSGGSLYSYETIVTEEVYPNGENYFVWNGDDTNPQITGTSRTLSVSNAVNCQIHLDQANNIFKVMVENGTQPASFTLTIS